MKQRLLLVVAVAAGLLAAFFSNQYLSSMRRDVENEKQKLLGQYRQTEAVGFGREMPRDTLIKRDDIVLLDKVLAASLRPNAVRKEDAMQLVGKRTVNSVPAGKPVNWSDIEGGEASHRFGLARDITAGMRAVSINVSGSASVSGQVRPNDKVDVIGTFVLDSLDRPNEKEQVTLTILQNVLVIGTGRETSHTLAQVSVDRAGSYSTVTLLVTPREAETIVACEQNRGRLTLALRNPADFGYEDELPTVDFKYIRETLSAINKKRQETIPRTPTPPVLR